MPAISIKNLRKRYGKLQAVKGISFNVEKGDFFGFIGPNGAGKTTTIQSIMGLLKYQGTIKVLGYDVVKEYRAAREKIGLSPQEYNFDRFLTVEEVLYYTAGYYGIPKAEGKRRAEALMKRFHLTAKRKQRSETLSGGMKRRLIIARALIHQPEILILDEPTAGLDVNLRRELWEELSKINREGTTIILTTHYIEEVEQLCNTVAIINHGRIIAHDTKEKIMENLSSQTLQLKTDKAIPEKLLGKFHCVKVEKGVTRIIGKGVRKAAPSLIKRIERAGITIKEMDIFNENLENVFLRLTEGKR